MMLKKKRSIIPLYERRKQEKKEEEKEEKRKTVKNGKEKDIQKYKCVTHIRGSKCMSTVCKRQANEHTSKEGEKKGKGNNRQKKQRKKAKFTQETYSSQDRQP